MFPPAVSDLPCQWVDFTDIAQSRGDQEMCLCVSVSWHDCDVPAWLGLTAAAAMHAWACCSTAPTATVAHVTPRVPTACACCVAWQVNSDENVNTKATNIGNEINKRNNRHCVPFKYNDLPKVRAQPPGLPVRLLLWSSGTATAWPSRSCAWCMRKLRPSA